MKLPTLPFDVANQIYDILVKFAGALERWREDFVHRQEHGCCEYRFQGSLGFGGKFWNVGDRWDVTCYREDENPERRQAIQLCNAELAKLKESLCTPTSKTS